VEVLSGEGRVSYELAPSTALVATDCALCGHPLRDAVSVEIGVGPICRKKYGYTEAQAPANVMQARVEARAAFDGELPATLDEALCACDARRAANILIHRAAVEQLSPRTRHLTAAISALGFTAVADRLVERIAGRDAVRITTEGDRLVVHAPFNYAFNDHARTIPGSHWNQDLRARIVPAAQKRALWAALRASFPEGTLVVGTRVVVLAGNPRRAA
jgi:hypothetical protein